MTLNTMVCPEEEEAICVIKDLSDDSVLKKFCVKVRSQYTVEKLFEHVGLQSSYPNFDLIIPSHPDSNSTEGIKLYYLKQEKLTNVGIQFGGARNNLIICPLDESAMMNSSPRVDSLFSDDDMALGASASPVESSDCYMPAPPPLPAPLFDSDSIQKCRLRRYNGESSQSLSHNYRGLVNQAMTCYLNSLLQALFMTPEFRNAMYNWVYGKEEESNIPYQLQKLFVNLQTSPKSAVETTDLTRSFGWDSSASWQQHDIQELCRVMFDALEKTFENTKQADLINQLYQGKMIDYVKCLECNKEKQREDMFLDIPLPVRPFGSTVAYETIEDALRAFVQPEILDGNNQYHCETCDKKCDAHKGLKFTKFPYILTLHLKRFDFDYQTFHRIKLNDKVTFPQYLNLNNFINTVPQTDDKSTVTAGGSSNGNADPVLTMQMETAENFMKTYDECSTTDSGSALEEDSSFQNGTSVSSSTTTPNDQFVTQDDDEGIDMELNGDSKSPSVSNFNAPGPYVYDLFAIMIHSGSASGGHYYAYIKDFESSKWFSFNDQTVSPITQDDIQKSFGGGSAKTYYSSAYSSSTNAYMLMYRQVDSSKNSLPIKEDEFPDHIKSLVAKIRDTDSCRSKGDKDTLHVKVYFEHPRTRAMESYKMYLLNEYTLDETLEEAYRVLKVKGIAPIERCRLVAYDRNTEIIETSFECQEDKTIDEIMKSLKKSSELLLETRDEDELFESYHPDSIMTKVYKVDVASRDVDGPITIPVRKDHTILHYKMRIGSKFKLNLAITDLVLAINEYKEGSRLLLDESKTVRDEGFIQYCKVFVTADNLDDSSFADKFNQFVSGLDHVVCMYLIVPFMDPATLKNMSIPRYIPKPQQTTVITNGKDAPIANTDSNSEDSSLSDNDKTLVEEDGHEHMNGDASHLHYSNGISTNGYTNGNDVDDDEDESLIAECRKSDYYFKVTTVEYHNANADSGAEDDSSSNSDNKKVIKVLIDKRANQAYLKYKLQSYLRIPMDYFNISRYHVTTLNEDTFKDGDRWVIELGRVLRKGEYKINLYYFNINDIDDDDTVKLPFMCNWIVRNGQTVGQIKRDILAHFATFYNQYNELSFDHCRLRSKPLKSNISKVYTDDQKIGEEVQLTRNPDLALQEVEDPASLTPKHYNDVLLFVRRWLPSELKLDKFKEILFANKCELRNLLSKISGIPEENIEYAKVQLRDCVSVLQVHNILQWSSAPSWSDDPQSTYNFQDGNIVYYRDKTETLMELTSEKRNELSKNINRNNATYSPRKERALKIYVDANPKSTDD